MYRVGGDLCDGLHQDEYRHQLRRRSDHRRQIRRISLALSFEYVYLPLLPTRSVLEPRRRGRGVTTIVRSLLSPLSISALTERREDERCCGSGSISQDSPSQGVCVVPSSGIVTPKHKLVMFSICLLESFHRLINIHRKTRQKRTTFRGPDNQSTCGRQRQAQREALFIPH